jgi:hypothetical protein
MKLVGMEVSSQEWLPVRTCSLAHESDQPELYLPALGAVEVWDADGRRVRQRALQEEVSRHTRA